MLLLLTSQLLVTSRTDRNHFFTLCWHCYYSSVLVSLAAVSLGYHITNYATTILTSILTRSVCTSSPMLSLQDMLLMANAPSSYPYHPCSSRNHHSNDPAANVVASSLANGHCKSFAAASVGQWAAGALMDAQSYLLSHSAPVGQANSRGTINHDV